MALKFTKLKIIKKASEYPNREKVSLFFVMLAGSFFLFSLLILLLVSQLPNIDNLENYEFDLPTKIYDTNDKLIGELASKKRILIDKEEIPVQMKQAVIAIEDHYFYSHIGINLKRIIKTIWVDLVSLSFAQGASTITQQTAKLFLLSSDKKIIRKIKEILLAFQIESKFEKDEILELYLNKAYMGNGAWGIGAASKIYFSKQVSQLALGEMALLAGLVKAPSRLAPTNSAELALERRNLVLSEMAELEFITPEQFKIAKNQPITLNLSDIESQTAASYFIEEVRQKLISLGLKEIHRQGLKVYTTMDLDFQLAAQVALKKGLIAIDKRHGYRGVIGTVLNDDSELDPTEIENIKLFNRYNQLDKVYKAFIEEVTETELFVNLGDSGGKISIEDTGWALAWSPSRLIGGNVRLKDFRSSFKVGDVILISRNNTESNQFQLYQEPTNNGSIIALNPKNGKILAMSGGYNFQSSKFNRAIQSKRQPGSAFKPIVYATAIDRGYTAASILEDTPLGFNDYKKDFDWFPKNYGGDFSGNLTLRESLYKSKNIPTVKLAIDLGVKDIIKFAKKLNIQSKIQKDLSISLGSASLTLLELTNAYSVFANNGTQAVPYKIQKIKDRNGEVLYENNPQTKQVIPATTAYIITTILQDVITKGTGRGVNVFNRPIAGKTGTTNDNTDAWFIGYTPEIIAGVYVGNDQPTFSLGIYETGSRAAAPIWKNFMLSALKKYKEIDFEMPTGLEKVKIVKHNGLLDCKEREVSQNVYYEYFKITTTPTVCDESDSISSESEEILEEIIENDSNLSEENFEL